MSTTENEPISLNGTVPRRDHPDVPNDLSGTSEPFHGNKSQPSTSINSGENAKSSMQSETLETKTNDTTDHVVIPEESSRGKRSWEEVNQSQSTAAVPDSPTSPTTADVTEAEPTDPTTNSAPCANDLEPQPKRATYDNTTLQSNQGVAYCERDPTTTSPYPAELQFTVMARYVGFIIGRGGETLRRIEQTHQVRAHVEQDARDNPERLITIQGHTQENCENAKAAIMQLVHNAEERVKDNLADPDSTLSPDPNAYTIRFTIPASRIGKIIGRRGDRLRELREESGADIHVAHSHVTDPATGERPAVITGNEENVLRAKSLIDEIIQQELPSPDDHDRGDRHYRPHGTGFQNRRNSNYGTEEVRDTMLIPQSAVAFVIGRRGESIRTIQQQSGCRIQLDHNTNTPPHASREVTIWGPPDRIGYAKQLVGERVTSAGHRDGHRASYSGGYNNAMASQSYPGGYYDPYGSYYYGASGQAPAPGMTPSAESNSDQGYEKPYPNTGAGVSSDGTYSSEQYAQYYAQYAQMYPQYAAYYNQYYQQANGSAPQPSADPTQGGYDTHAPYANQQ
ncbi:hypothetical protein IWQ61_004192 [Dispira simplex]|nr:hypothetical protein IWQ61_004192 [Dispira simplex]